MNWPPDEERCAAAVGDRAMVVGLDDPVRESGRWATTCFSSAAIRLAENVTEQCDRESRYGDLCEEHEHQGCVRMRQNQRTCWGWGCGSIETTDTISVTCPCGLAKVIWLACSACAERWRTPLPPSDGHLFPGLFRKDTP
jgi:hypothetical protein